MIKTSNYLRLVNGNPVYPYEPSQLWIDYPQTSFPNRWDEADVLLASYGVFPVWQAPQPPIGRTKSLRLNSVPTLQGDKWVLDWQILTKTSQQLDQELQDIWDRIKSIRDQKIQMGGFPALGRWFHSDGISRSQQLALLMDSIMMQLEGRDLSLPMLDPVGQPLRWKTMDGTFVIMTGNVIRAIYSGAKHQEGLLHRHGEILWYQVKNAPNPHAVDVTLGWPTVYVPAAVVP